MDQLGRKIQILKIFVGSTMTQVYAKITMIQDTAYLVTAVFIYTTVRTTKLDGNLKKIMKRQNAKDGRRLTTLMLKRILTISRTSKNSNPSKFVSIVTKN